MKTKQGLLLVAVILGIMAPGGCEGFQVGQTSAGPVPDCDGWHTYRNREWTEDSGADVSWHDPNSFFVEASPGDVRHCLQLGKPLGVLDEEDGLTPLHLAAGLNQDPAVVTALLDAGADIDARDKYGHTMLHAVSWNENPAVVTALLDAGADIDARNGSGYTPLHLAAALNENPAVVTALLDAGADPAARNDSGNLPVDLIKDDSPLHGTPVYWRLRQAKYE